MIPLDILVSATGGKVVQRGSGDQFSAFASDAREVLGGECFVAVRGVHADGHDFATDAAQRGAAGVLVEADRLAAQPAWRAELLATGVTVVAVAEVRRALRDYAAAILRAWGPRVIAVAGSAGKTTTKEAIATVLGHHASTFRSWRNYNDLLGLPLSLGGLEPHHEFAVLEMASDFPGELEALAEIADPEIAVLLNAYETHLDGFGDQAGVVAALAALPNRMHAGQTVVLNDHFNTLRPLGEKLAQRTDGPRVMWFSGHDALVPTRAYMRNEVLGELPYLRITSGPAAQKYWATVFDQLYGSQWSDAIAATLNVAQLFGIDRETVFAYLNGFTPLPGRMRILDGKGGMQLLDDSHNAIPVATKAAIEVLEGFMGRAAPQFITPGIAVLGDMHHLGEAAAAHHADIGKHVAAINMRTSYVPPARPLWLVTRGELAEGIAHAAIARGMPTERVIITHTAEDAANAVLSIAAQSAYPPVVLIKGSPQMRMEAVTARLLADPASAPEVLDRQGAVWRRAMVGDLQRPTWLEIDLGAIGTNTRLVKDLVGPDVDVMATLKADAYGHGALKVARTALRNGATWLGVATVSEALPLRASGIDAPLLVYGYIPPWQAREAVQRRSRSTVYASETAGALARAASALGRVVAVHVKIDTGMARLGLRAEDIHAIIAFMREVGALPGLRIEGIYTHFATADEADQGYAQMQLARFHVVLDALRAEGLLPPIIHAANSAATLALPETRFSLVRPGIILYGLAPSEDVPLPGGFRPALSFKTQISQVKTIPPGEGISYGSTYVTTEPERVAVLPVGYADGFRRGPANWGEVLIRGQRAPIRGRVCMDQTVVSVAHIPDARAGDEAVLIGTQGSDHLTAEEVAARLGTSNYEVVAAILARVPRLNG